MKKIISILLFLYTIPVSAESFFQLLCSTFYKENLSIKKDFMEEKLYRIRKNEQYIKVLPKINLYGSLYYSEENFEKEYPEYAKLWTEINQDFLWGSKLSLTGEFSYNNISEEDNKYEYEGQTSVSATFIQSMAPYIFSFPIKNPEFYINKLNYLSTVAKVKYDSFNIINKFLLTYLDYKELKRQIEIKYKNLIYYEELFSSEKQLYDAEKGSYINLYDKNQKLLSEKNEYENLKKQEEQFILAFQEFCNYMLTFQETKTLLEKSESEAWADIFFDFFPEWNIDNFFDYEQQINNYDLDKIKTQFLYNRQTYAPKIILSASCSYNSTNKHNFELCVGFDFSSVFTPENLNLKKEYNLQKQILLDSIQLKVKKNDDLKNTYLQNLKYFNLKSDQLSERLDFAETLYKDYEDLYRSGKCSKLDLMSAELNYLQIKNELMNNNDKIFYYNLLLKVEISK